MQRNGKLDSSDDGFVAAYSRQRTLNARHTLIDSVVRQGISTFILYILHPRIQPRDVRQDRPAWLRRSGQ